MKSNGGHQFPVSHVFSPSSKCIIKMLKFQLQKYCYQKRLKKYRIKIKCINCSYVTRQSCSVDGIAVESKTTSDDFSNILNHHMPLTLVTISFTLTPCSEIANLTWSSLSGINRIFPSSWNSYNTKSFHFHFVNWTLFYTMVNQTKLLPNKTVRSN